jgi:hypothetical protein
MLRLTGSRHRKGTDGSFYLLGFWAARSGANWSGLTEEFHQETFSIASLYWQAGALQAPLLAGSATDLVAASQACMRPEFTSIIQFLNLSKIVEGGVLDLKAAWFG